MRSIQVILPLSVVLSGIAAADTAAQAGMVKIPGGTFTMGSTLPGSGQDEKPPVSVTLDGFWLDVTPVTNAEFRKFTGAAGYKTIAERPINWEEMENQPSIRLARSPVTRPVIRFNRNASSEAARSCAMSPTARAIAPAPVADLPPTAA